MRESVSRKVVKTLKILEKLTTYISVEFQGQFCTFWFIDDIHISGAKIVWDLIDPVGDRPRGAMFYVSDIVAFFNAMLCSIGDDTVFILDEKRLSLNVKQGCGSVSVKPVHPMVVSQTVNSHRSFVFQTFNSIDFKPMLDAQVNIINISFDAIAHKFTFASQKYDVTYTHVSNAFTTLKKSYTAKFERDIFLTMMKLNSGKTFEMGMSDENVGFFIFRFKSLSGFIVMSVI